MLGGDTFSSQMRLNIDVSTAIYGDHDLRTAKCVSVGRRWRVGPAQNFVTETDCVAAGGPVTPAAEWYLQVIFRSIA
jgi:hypothetical protein